MNSHDSPIAPRALPPPSIHRPTQRLLHSLAVALLLLAALVLMPGVQAASASAGAAGAGDQPVVQQLLEAMSSKNYQAFVDLGTPAFAQIGENQFNEVADSIGARLKQGYTVEYLGTLQQQGLDISVWKVSFTDKGDDLLATLNVQNGSVGGFFLR